MLRIGYHISIAGSFDLAFDRAKAMGCTDMQIFPSNPRSWAMKKLDCEEVEAFRMKAKHFDIRPVLAHMPYLPNLASPDPVVYEKSVNALHDVAMRCKALGIRHIVAHLGSHKGSGVGKGLERIAKALDGSADSLEGLVLLFENEANQKNSIGSRLEELDRLKKMVGIECGFCIDTCHIFAAGYDIRKEETTDLIDSVIGIGNIKAIHMNDAKYELGSCRDRHENIGFGQIGIEGFRTFFSRKELRKKPIIMETPMTGKITAKREMEVARSILES